MAQLLFYGLELSTEKKLSLRLFHSLFDVVLDTVAQGQVGQRVTGPSEHETQSRFDVDRLEDFDLLGEREVRGVARDVGEAPGLGDLAQLRGKLTRAATQQNVLEHRAVLTRELDDVGCRLSVAEGFGFYPESVTGPRNSGANGGALVATNGDRLEATGQRTLFHHFSDDTNARVATFDVGYEEKVPAGGAGRVDSDP